jgi:opacity protein-like surface antigen
MKKVLIFVLTIIIFPYYLHAQYGYINYPMKANMFGIVGGLFLTSNPDMSGYDTKKNYTDYGGGLVYDYRNDVSKNYTFEFLTSLMITSCNTSKTEEGQSKMKFILPLEMRFYVGTTDFKFFIGAGLQYNFIYSFKENEKDNYNTYGYYDWYGNYYYYDYYTGTTTEYEEDTKAHQLSGNGSIGFSILGMQSPVHILLGAKFHFPIINNAEGKEFSNGSRFDFSKDKTSITATAGLSFNLGKKSVLMLNYDYPLGSTKETTVDNGDKRNFFETHSQSLTMSILWRL